MKIGGITLDRLRDGRIVRLDYFGNGGAEALCRELSAILRGGSGVAN